MVAVPTTDGSFCDVAVTIRLSGPCAALLAAPMVIGTFTVAPAGTGTCIIPSVASSAAGPPRASVNVSSALPSFVTCNVSILFGVGLAGLNASEAPALTVVSVADPVPETNGLVIDVAVTMNGRLPGLLPLGVRVSMTSRKLPAPGGTSMVCLLNASRTVDGGRPETARPNVSSAPPTFVTCTMYVADVPKPAVASMGVTATTTPCAIVLGG